MAAKKKVVYKGNAAKIIDKLAKGSSERVVKTLSLDGDHFGRLEKMCDELGMKVSHVIDELIAGFLDDADQGKRR